MNTIETCTKNLINQQERQLLDGFITNGVEMTVGYFKSNCPELQEETGLLSEFFPGEHVSLDQTLIEFAGTKIGIYFISVFGLQFYKNKSAALYGMDGYPKVTEERQNILTKGNYDFSYFF